MLSSDAILAGKPDVPAPNSVHEDVIAPQHASHERVIAIAVDSSKYSQHAFQWAVDNLIRPETDQVVILNVRPFVPLAYGPMYLDYTSPLYLDYNSKFEAIENSNKEASHDLIRAYAARLPLSANYNVRGVALLGDPRDEIAYKVDEMKADVLVIGSRGLGMLKRAVMGSVSDYLLHTLNIPVIIPKLP